MCGWYRMLLIKKSHYREEVYFWKHEILRWTEKITENNGQHLKDVTSSVECDNITVEI